MILARTILAVAAPAAALLAFASVGGAAPESKGSAERAFDSKCGAFPAATGVAADAPSIPDQRAWSQDISGAPTDPAVEAC